jgi:hypothetical protein
MRRQKKFTGSVAVMREIIALDPELDPKAIEYWRVRLRAGGWRRVLRALRNIAFVVFAGIGMAVVIVWLLSRFGVVKH